MFTIQKIYLVSTKMSMHQNEYWTATKVSISCASYLSPTLGDTQVRSRSTYQQMRCHWWEHSGCHWNLQWLCSLWLRRASLLWGRWARCLCCLCCHCRCPHPPQKAALASHPHWADPGRLHNSNTIHVWKWGTVRSHEGKVITTYLQQLKPIHQWITIY